jgi:hypothetical protein
MSEGELKKRIRKCIPDYFKETEEDNAITWAIDEAKKDLEKGSHRSWISPDEPKPPITYICIEYEKWKKWFGT